MLTKTLPRPFIKWPGGKQRLAPTLIEFFPDSFSRYYEPFLGGGSVAILLRPQRAVLADANSWLMDTYRAIRDDQAGVAKALRRLPNTREDFLRLRALSPQAMSPARRAAQFIYLNKTCFRGLFRVNRKGRFNVPYGDYERRYFDPHNFSAVSDFLAGVDLRTGDFEAGLAGVTDADFVYLDPPYHKLGGFSDFNRYTPGQFHEADHGRLAALCRELDGQGVRWALSNSDTPLVRELFEGFSLHPVSARREINLDAKSRDISELLVTNY